MGRAPAEPAAPMEPAVGCTQPANDVRRGSPPRSVICPSRGLHAEVSPRQTSRGSNKIPAALSLEASELHRLLRQDMQDCLRSVVRQDLRECLRGIVGVEMQDLRRELAEWLSQACAPQSAPPSLKESPGGHGALGESGVAHLGSGIGTPSAQCLGPASTGAGGGQPSAEPGEGAAPALGPDGVAPAADRYLDAGHAGVGPRAPGDARAQQVQEGSLETHQPAPLEHREGEAGVLSAELERSTPTHHSSVASTTLFDGEGEAGNAIRWEWERSNGRGWAPYSAEQSRKIEHGWEDGLSKVRLRSGTHGKTPVEIFFVDMVQFDPDSENVRQVRRVGEVPWRRRARRVWNAAARSLETREYPWESFKQYRERQTSVRTIQTRESKRSVNPFAGSQIRQSLRTCVDKGGCLRNMSLLVTTSFCVWIGIDVDRYPHGTSIYEKDAPSIAVEISFYTFFLGELVVRLLASTSLRECLLDVWILFDALCVLGSLIDVILVPVVVAVIPGFHSEDHTDTEIAVFRILRLLKLVRVVRFTRASGEVMIFLRGLLSGLAQSFIIWAILLVTVYVSSMMLRTYADDEVVEKYFGTLLLTMNRLIVSGILLDGVEDVLNDMISYGDYALYFGFLLFVFFSQFIILNMLIGIITSVAGDVRRAEKTCAKEKYLRDNLESIVECYVQDAGKISRKEFRLISRNADAHNILEQSGTDAARLAEIEDSLYATSDQIDSCSLYSTIALMNASKLATVSDVFYTQDVLSRRLNAIESRLAAGGLHGHPRQQCRP